jgi:hypothetical protein
MPEIRAIVDRANYSLEMFGIQLGHYHFPENYKSSSPAVV